MEWTNVFTDALGDVSRRSLELDGFALGTIIVNEGTGEPGEAFKDWLPDWRRLQQRAWEKYGSRRR